jgi:hypothetical protein
MQTRSISQRLPETFSIGKRTHEMLIHSQHFASLRRVYLDCCGISNAVQGFFSCGAIRRSHAPGPLCQVRPADGFRPLPARKWAGAVPTHRLNARENVNACGRHAAHAGASRRPYQRRA